MNDLLADTRYWFVAMLGLISGLMRYLWKKQEKRLDALEGDAVRRAEFERLRADFQAKHEENSGKLDKGFGRIESLIRDEKKQTDEHREKLRSSIEELGRDVAVLKDRAGDGIFDDAGRVRR